jgi:hypothetical protein
VGGAVVGEGCHAQEQDGGKSGRGAQNKKKEREEARQAILRVQGAAAWGGGEGHARVKRGAERRRSERLGAGRCSSSSSAASFRSGLRRLCRRVLRTEYSLVYICLSLSLSAAALRASETHGGVCAGMYVCLSLSICMYVCMYVCVCVC